MSHVIAGCLHRDQRDAMTAQVSGEGQQRTRGCPVLPDLLAPPPGLVCVRNPHAGRQGRLAQVQRSHALDQLRQIACLLHQEPPLPCSRNGTAARGSSREDKSRTHVLKATLRGPWRNSQRQTVKRPPPRAKTVRRRRATTPIFTPAGRPRQGTFLTVKPSAKPTLVRTQHLPPPAEIARELGFPGLAGCCFWPGEVPLCPCESGCFQLCTDIERTASAIMGPVGWVVVVGSLWARRRKKRLT